MNLCVIMEYVNVVVDNFTDYNDIIHDYLSKGFSLISYDEKSVCIKKNGYGSFKNHLLLFIFTIWWSFGLANLFYLLYSYFISVKRYRIVFKENINDDCSNGNDFNYSFINGEYIARYLLDDDGNNLNSSKDFQNDSSLPIVQFLEE